jgi:hypothetical protein
VVILSVVILSVVRQPMNNPGQAVFAAIFG